MLKAVIGMGALRLVKENGKDRILRSVREVSQRPP
jgi:hypothetical protein